MESTTFLSDEVTHSSFWIVLTWRKYNLLPLHQHLRQLQFRMNDQTDLTSHEWQSCPDWGYPAPIKQCCVEKKHYYSTLYGRHSQPNQFALFCFHCIACRKASISLSWSLEVFFCLPPLINFSSSAQTSFWAFISYKIWWGCCREV